MAGTIIADFIRTDANKLSLNVGNTTFATINAGGLYSNTGVQIINQNGGFAANTIGTTQLQDTTITQAKLASGVTSTGPLFHATSDALTFGSASFTKMPFAGEVYDTANCYDTTNYRFLPNVPGYYFFRVSIFIGLGSGRGIISFYKNNGDVGQNGQPGSNVNGGVTYANNMLIYLNGTTDYVECFIYQETGSNVTINNNGGLTHWSGFLVRAA